MSNRLDGPQGACELFPLPDPCAACGGPSGADFEAHLIGVEFLAFCRDCLNRDRHVTLARFAEIAGGRRG